MKFTGRKGWQANYKDTFSLDYTLSPIILAGLKKFYEQKDNDYFGIPGIIFDTFNLNQETEHDLAVIIWEYILETMIYAFDNTNIPEASDFGYSVEMVRGEKKENGCREVSFKVSSEESKKVYYDAVAEHEKLCELGRMNFAKYFTNLWW